MNIDWFTFIAQIVNFLILVALLRWLLYEPVVRAMQAREDRIARRLEEADEKRVEAEDKLREYEQKSQSLDDQREELLAEAREGIRLEREKLLKEAKEDVAQRREQWQESLRRERGQLLADLQRQAGQMGLKAARRMLEQLADAELESRMWESFLSQLEEAGDGKLGDIQNYLADTGDATLTLHSVFELDDSQRQRIGKSLRESLQTEVEIAFEQSTDLICGLEMDAGGYTFGWSVKDFLHDLELDFMDRLGEHR